MDSESGCLQMSKLISVLAGGLTHAMKYIRGQMVKTRNIGRLFIALSALSFATAISFAYNNYIKKL